MYSFDRNGITSCSTEKGTHTVVILNYPPFPQLQTSFIWPFLLASILYQWVLGLLYSPKSTSCFCILISIWKTLLSGAPEWPLPWEQGRRTTLWNFYSESKTELSTSTWVLPEEVDAFLALSQGHFWLPPAQLCFPLHIIQLFCRQPSLCAAARRSWSCI